MEGRGLDKMPRGSRPSEATDRRRQEPQVTEVGVGATRRGGGRWDNWHVVDWTRRSRRSGQNLPVVEAMSVACSVTDTLSTKETNRQTGQPTETVECMGFAVERGFAPNHTLNNGSTARSEGKGATFGNAPFSPKKGAFAQKSTLFSTFSIRGGPFGA